jgi:TolB-like protein
LTMEYVEGTSLSRVLEQSRTLSIARTIEIASAVAAGLGAAHAVGVVHRDLKPENVLIAKDGRAVITDFGVARPMESGSTTVTMGLAVGTPAYMAPEQVEARRDIDQRADIYALGVVLFELLSGELPFVGDTALAMAAARLVQPVPDVRSRRPDVPAPLAELVRKCMARDRDARFSNVGEIVRALASITMPLQTRMSITPPASAPSNAAKAIAVLPFRNAGSNDDAFIAEGLWEDLIDGLSMTNGLRVRPRSSVVRYFGVDKDPTEVGKELGVDVIVEGSVRRLGEHIRVAARLLNVGDGFQLWAKKFDRQSKDLFALSDEMATAVAEALTIERTVPERHAPATGAAVELYLKARAASRKMFRDAMPQAVALYEQALQLAPDDPTILAGYAFIQIRRWFFGHEDAFEHAKSAAERAIAAAPHLHEARHTLAVLKLHTGDQIGSFREFKSLAAQGHLGAHESLAGLLSEIDMEAEGRAHIDAALQIDPSSPFAHYELCRFYALRGQWVEGELAMQRLLGGDSSAQRSELSAAYLRFLIWRGEVAEARARIATNPNTHRGPLSRDVLDAVLSGGTDPVVLREVFRNAQVAGSIRRRSLLHQLEVEIAGLLGAGDWAIDALTRADEALLLDLAWMRRCPILTCAREHPGYAEVERRVAARARVLELAYRER